MVCSDIACCNGQFIRSVGDFAEVFRQDDVSDLRIDDIVRLNDGERLCGGLDGF